MRPRYFFLSLLLLLSLLLVGISAYAQDIQPPQPPGTYDFYTEMRIIGTRSYGAADEIASPSIGLGKPGLSYRYEMTFGVSESPYNVDNNHFERPRALAVDSADKVYVVDENGSRVYKFNENGNYQWNIGIPGIHSIVEGKDIFNWPRDVGVDGSGKIWIVDGDRVVQYNSSGVYQQIFPEWEDQPWHCDDDNGHFCWPNGIAFDNFDSKNWMYVSDSDNQRVQVFNITSGTPVYSTTIGVTGETGSDNNHFYDPGQLAVDGFNNLYVADKENARIQKCSYSSGWTCATFHGTGSFGDGDDQLEYVEGLGILGNTLYIADSGNNRIKSCDATSFPGICGTFATAIDYPTDVAAISTDRVLITVAPDFSVHEYNNSGDRTGIFAGTGGEPYLTDNKRLNRPRGTAVGLDGSLYVSEEHGQRLVKMDPAGNQLDAAWPIGEPGKWGDDNYHFDGPRGNLAVDAKGQILVPDMYNHRVQIYDSGGDHKYTIGTTGNSGSDNSHFRAPAGVAVDPINGDVLVADRRNHRVQIFKSNYQYKATLGQTGNPGTTNNQFDQPWGVFVDKNGDIYVADRQNHRVQIFDKNRVYKATLGKTGQCEWGFDYLCAPHSVVVDDFGRIFVSEEWVNRVKVFDKNYKYLTTIGGNYESTSGEFRNPSGLALDKYGNLYLADTGNHRVQKFSPVIFGWQQSNLDGFGDIENIIVGALGSFNPLVAGVFNGTKGAELWKLENGVWTSLMKGGFGEPKNVGITDLIQFKGNYYASTSADETAGGEIWRSSNLQNWDWVVNDGFGDTTNGEINRLTVFKDMLYATTWSWDTGTHGAEIWRSSSGNKGSWNRVVSNGFGDKNNEGIISLVIFKDQLYASTTNRTSGADVWRSGNGSSWTKVNNSGFGDFNNQRVVLAPYIDYLYAGTQNRVGPQTGGELWRCIKCDSSDWKEVTTQQGFGDPANWGLTPVGVPGNTLFVFTDNRTTGMQMWMSVDGEFFRKAGPDGFGDSRNYFPGGFAVHNKALYVGTGNWGNAGEIWFRKSFDYLPSSFK